MTLPLPVLAALGKGPTRYNKVAMCLPQVLLPGGNKKLSYLLAKLTV